METRFDDVSEILIVDDKPENLFALEEILASPDVKFIRANSGEAALEATLTSRPALIILDVQMPGMNGFEVARALRSLDRTRMIPIIFVTATHRDEKFSFEGFESGAVDYLFKPLNPTIVSSKVRVFVELHRKSRRLERTIREISLVNRELESFSYAVSHDLKAPVRGIIGFAEEVKNLLEKNEVEKSKTYLSRIINAGKKMNELVDALLKLAHVTQQPLSRERVNLSEIVSGVSNELKREYSSAAVKLQVEENVTAIGDAKLLEIAVRNLLSNAFKFTSKIGQAKIDFGVLKKQNENIYYVRDNGVGFSMEHAGRLFTAFQRLHDQTEFSGTGIGLATVQRIVHRHQGRVWAEASPNNGASFYFTV